MLACVLLHLYRSDVRLLVQSHKGSIQGLTISTLHSPVLCSAAVLCCAVLCCAMLCCAVLCCAVLCCAVLCCAVLCCAVDKTARQTPLLSQSTNATAAAANTMLCYAISCNGQV